MLRLWSAGKKTDGKCSEHNVKWAARYLDFHGQFTTNTLITQNPDFRTPTKEITQIMRNHAIICNYIGPPPKENHHISIFTTSASSGV